MECFGRVRNWGLVVFALATAPVVAEDLLHVVPLDTDVLAALEGQLLEGAGADVSELRVIQRGYHDSACPPHPQCPQETCNVVTLLWRETTLNGLGVEVLVDGNVVSVDEGLPGEELPASNGFTLIGVSSGMHVFAVRPVGQDELAISAEFEVLEGQPFPDITALNCSPGEPDADGNVRLAVTWERNSPQPDDYVVLVNGNSLGQIAGNNSAVNIENVGPGDYCIEIFGRTGNATAEYWGCPIETCCTVAGPAQEEGCCGSPFNLGFSTTPVSSANPFEKVVDLAEGCVGNSGEVVIESCSGEPETATAYVNVISDSDDLAVAGWSIGVAIDGPALVLAATTDGLAGGDAPAFTITEIVDPATNGGQYGVISSVILSLPPDDERTLPPLGTSSLLAIDLALDRTAVNGAGPVIGLGFRDGLRGTGQPVDNVVSVGPAAEAESMRPCNVDSAGIAFRFERSTPSAGRTFRRGDPDASGGMDLGDVLHILGFLFQNGEAPHCLAAADVNDDGELDLGDPLFLLFYLFLQTTPVPPPTECGTDTNPGGLGCAAYPACGGRASLADVERAWESLVNQYGREFSGTAGEGGSGGRAGIGSLATLDLTGDGVDEIVGLLAGGDQLDIYEVEPGGTPRQIAALRPGSGIGALTIASRGADEVLAVITQGDPELVILNAPSLCSAERYALPGTPFALVATDLDGDRNDDFVMAAGADPSLYVALSSLDNALLISELPWRPGMLMARDGDGETAAEVFVFQARGPDSYAVTYDGKALVMLPFGELMEPTPPGYSRLEVWPLDVDGVAPDDFLIREVGDLGNLQQLVPYYPEGGFYVRGSPIALDPRTRNVDLVTLPGLGLPDIVAQLWDPELEAVTWTTFAHEAPGAFLPATTVPISTLSPAFLSLGGIQIVAGILPLGFGCGGITGAATKINSTAAKAVAFKTVLCRIISMLTAFAPLATGNVIPGRVIEPTTMNEGPILIPPLTVKTFITNVIDEVGDQKAANEIWIATLTAGGGAWTEPVSGDMVFNPTEVCGVTFNPAAANFWSLVRLILHEGCHAEYMTGETTTTRRTEAVLTSILADLRNPAGYFAGPGPLGAGFTGPQRAAAINHVLLQKWEEAAYRHRVNDSWTELAKARIRDACDTGSTVYATTQAAILRRHGGTAVSLPMPPGTINCTKRCYTGRVRFTYCGVTEFHPKRTAGIFRIWCDK